MKKLKQFLVTINGIDYHVNAENESVAEWCAVAQSVKRGSCTDAEFSAADIQKITELNKATEGTK